MTPQFSLRKLISMPTMVLLVSLLLSACQAVGVPVSTPTPVMTATSFPSAPTTHQISFGDVNVHGVVAGPQGLVFQGAPPRGLYFYDFASQSIHTLVDLPAVYDGAPGSLFGQLRIVLGGNWVVYGVSNRLYGQWELRAVNVLTRENRLIDSYKAEHSPPNAWWNFSFSTDGTYVAWTATVGDKNLNMALRVYNLVTGTTQTLLSGPELGAPSEPSIDPVALTNGVMLLAENYQLPDATNGLYLWRMGDAEPHQIAHDTPSNGEHLAASLSDRYVIWDDEHLMLVHVYDRATGQIHYNVATGCRHPQIALDRPYAVCVDDTNLNHILYLISITGWKKVAFGSGYASDAAIANGRAYWIPYDPNANAVANNIVDYIDLPAA